MARRTSLLLLGLTCLGFFGAGVLCGDQAKKEALGREIVDATSMVAYMTASARTMLDLWVQQEMITGAEKEVAAKTLTTGKSRDAIREVTASALVAEFDEPTLTRVAAFYQTAEGRAWAMRYEDTMQKATEVFGLAMLKGIRAARR